MPINVEVDQAIKSGAPFDVTLSVDDGVGTFVMTVTVNGVARQFLLNLGAVGQDPTGVIVLDQSTWTIRDWGSGAVGARVVVALQEIAPGTRTGSDRGAIVA